MNKRAWVFIAIMVGFIGGGLLYRHIAQEVDSRGATRLMRAIEENNTDKVLKLLEAADVNVRDKSGQTALFYAAKYAEEPKVIYKLIVAGADPFATDNSGNTPLVTAAKYNPSTEVVMALAKQSHKVSQQQANKNKALVKAAKYNTASVIRTLLVAQASPAPLDPNEKGAAAFLNENEKLTEQEKADYRQIMLMLEILEAREQFANSMKAITPAKESKAAAEKTNKTTAKKGKAQPSPVVEKKANDAKTADVKAEPVSISEKSAEKSTEEMKETIPQEKQMDSKSN